MVTPGSVVVGDFSLPAPGRLVVGSRAAPLVAEGTCAVRAEIARRQQAPNAVSETESLILVLLSATPPPVRLSSWRIRPSPSDAIGIAWYSS
jgi:hypothetical protein